MKHAGNGHASIHENGQPMALFPGSLRVVLVEIEQVVPNCVQHISRLVPANDATQDQDA